MDFEKFVSLLERRALYFTRLTRFADPFEGLPVRRHVEIARQLPPEDLAGFMRSVKACREIHCASCWHMNTEESDAMWKVYAGSGARIAIRSKFYLFKAALSVSPHPQVLAGIVECADYDTDQLLREPFLEELAFSKRRCFEFEREFRGFVRDEQVEAAGVEVPVDVDRLVERVYVSPMSPTWTLEVVKAVCARYELKAEVVQSEIMTGPSYLPGGSANL
jgi:hypothetical protein